MPVNFSAFFNDSLLLSSLYSSLNPFGLDCLIIKPNSMFFCIFTITTILLLPLWILILYHGLQQWWQQHSTSTTATTTHSDSFTYHLATMELIGVFGNILCCYGLYENHLKMLLPWYYLYCFNWYGETFFQLLTCVEHYLAVVHPITYLSLRKERGIGIRNIIVGCIWLLCFGLTGLVNTGIIVDVCVLISAFFIISFCSLYVLCILVRPGPGEQSRGRGRVDKSKQRAFYTILSILGVLLVRCSWNLAWDVLYLLNGNINACVWVICGVWINLSGSLVLPLLFLHRAGILASCKNKIK